MIRAVFTISDLSPRRLCITWKSLSCPLHQAVMWPTVQQHHKGSKSKIPYNLLRYHFVVVKCAVDRCWQVVNNEWTTRGVSTKTQDDKWQRESQRRLFYMARHMKRTEQCAIILDLSQRECMAWKGTLCNIRQVNRITEQRARRAIFCINHKQTLFSSSWMHLRRSMKIPSLPRKRWLPYRSHVCSNWAVPISWPPIGTITRLVCAPFVPGRRWGWRWSPGRWLLPWPRWWLPFGAIPSIIASFSLLLLGFLDLVVPDFQLRGWRSAEIFEGQFTNGHENRKEPRQVGWSNPKISVLELQNSLGLRNIVVLRRTFMTISSFRNWIIPFCSFLQQNFHSIRTGINYIFSFLTIFHHLRWSAPMCPH